MMQTLDSPSFQSPSPTVSESNLQTPNTSSSSLSATRLWRPAAQRNLRNQWSKLVSHKQQWVSASSSGRSHATSLVNFHLSQRYLPAMDLGVLSDMPNIRSKASHKLVWKQEFHQNKLLLSYKDMVVVVSQMVNVCSSMRCFHKGPASSPLVQFSSHSEDVNDMGDGGGIPAYKFLSISYFEKLAQELVKMYSLELILKRLLVVEFLSLSFEVPQKTDRLSWSDELYPGEFDDLRVCNLYSEKTCQPVLPSINGGESGTPTKVPSNHQLDREVLEVCLTTWLTEVNVDTYRVDEIFDMVGEEMHVKFS